MGTVTTGPRPLQLVLRTVGAVYLLAVFYVTLAPRFGVSGALTPNFLPLASIYDLLFDSAATPALIAKNLIGNVVLLAPLGVLLSAGLGWARLRALRGVAVVSLAIEVIQGLGLTDGRQANVDDPLLNLLGAAAAIQGLHLLTGRARWSRGAGRRGGLSREGV